LNQILFAEQYEDLLGGLLHGYRGMNPVRPWHELEWVDGRVLLVVYVLRHLDLLIVVEA
jgi:hypothetical protein